MYPKKKAASKGVLNQLAGLVISLVVVGIVLVIGFSIMATMQGTLTVGTAAYNATTQTISGMAQIPTWIPIIVVAVIGAVILGIVYLYMGKQK